MKGKPPANPGASLGERETLRGREGEILISQLLRASIGLQKALDRCFAQAGFTAQEAAVLVHCAEAKELSPGKLAQAMGRDKGKITRFVNRLEADGFLRRVSSQQDHRFQIVKPTARAQRVVPALKQTFEQAREEFLAGIQSEDLSRLGSVLLALHQNAGACYKDKTPAGSKENDRRVTGALRR